MKKVKNITTKNSSIGELYYESLSQEIKDKVLLILIIMVIKRSEEIKSRGVVNRSYERLYVDKVEYTSLTSDFYVLKYACATAAKEERDVVLVDLSGFFLQTEADENDKTIEKLTSGVALLLVEYNKKQRKHLKHKNEK